MDHLVIAIGQSYERASAPGSLYTVLKVERRSAPAFNGQAWHVTLLCVVAPNHWVMDHPGRRLNEVVGSLGLESHGYTRVG